MTNANSTLRVGLIGYGYAGKTFHAPLIGATPGLQLAAVVSRDADMEKLIHEFRNSLLIERIKMDTWESRNNQGPSAS